MMATVSGFMRVHGFIDVLTTCKEMYSDFFFRVVGRGSCRKSCRLSHSYRIFIYLFDGKDNQYYLYTLGKKGLPVLEQAR